MHRLALLSIVACIAFVSVPAAAQTNSQVAEAVIAITKAQWAAEIAKRPAATAMKSVANEYTEFNPGFPTRLDSKGLNMRLSEASSGGSDQLVAAEMANQHVQVYGDVAVLTYNFMGMIKDKDGAVEPFLAKSTRVYVKKSGQWMLVHANFAPVN